MDVAQQLVHGFALCGATRNSGNLGPEAAFLRLVHDDLDLHVGAPVQGDNNRRSQARNKVPTSRENGAKIMAKRAKNKAAAEGAEVESYKHKEAKRDIELAARRFGELRKD